MSEPASRPAEQRTPLSTAVRRWGLRPTDAAVLPLLVVLGALLGVWSVLLVPTGPRIGGHLLSVGAAVAIVGNLVVVRIGHRASAPFGGAVVLLGWTVVVFLLQERRANGSLLLLGAGDLAVPGLVASFGGLVVGLLAALVRVPR